MCTPDVRPRERATRVCGPGPWPGRVAGPPALAARRRLPALLTARPRPSPTARRPQQNFGAALRCAHFLGVDGVLTCHRNSAPLSAVVSKASAGAMELLPVHSTKCGGPARGGGPWSSRLARRRAAVCVCVCAHGGAAAAGAGRCLVGRRRSRRGACAPHLGGRAVGGPAPPTSARLPCQTALPSLRAATALGLLATSVCLPPPAGACHRRWPTRSGAAGRCWAPPPSRAPPLPPPLCCGSPRCW